MSIIRRRIHNISKIISILFSQIIRKEWQRVHDVLMEIERIQREVSQYLEANEEIILSGQPQTLHSEIYAQAAIDLQKQIDVRAFFFIFILNN